MRRKLLQVLSAVMLATLGAWSAKAAETSQVISFTGCDASLTGPVDLRLRLFTASSGGTLVYDEAQMNVDATSGAIY